MDVSQTLYWSSARVGLWARGAWLLALYLFSIVAVTVALTAYQLQHNIRTFDAGGASLAVWRVLQLRDSWNQAQSTKVNAETALAAAQETIEQRTQEAAKRSQENSAAGYVLVDVENEFAGVLIAAGVEAKAIVPRGEELTTAYAHLGNDKRTQPDIAGAYQKLISAREAANNTMNASLTADETLEGAQDLADQRRAVVVESINSVSKVFDAYKDERVRDAMGDFLTQLNYLSSIPGGRFFEFGAMANDMLTLILVLSMGSLGGTIHLTRIYLAGESRSLSYYLFRPLLGAITALAVYIVARAGVFVLSDPAASGARSPLSPFFISFLAIISGLLAERAIMGIETVGSGWFSSAVDQQRWAANVGKEIASQNKNISDLEPLLNADSARTSAWLDQREPVPLSAQTTIAAWLGKPIRDLFSDLPPPKPAGGQLPT